MVVSLVIARFVRAVAKPTAASQPQLGATKRNKESSKCLNQRPRCNGKITFTLS
jgi:hypothetical protein